MTTIGRLEHYSITMADLADLNFLGKQQERILQELAQLRAENRQVRLAFTSISESFSRQARNNSELERRISELRDDMETMLKLEIGGAIANFETRLDERLHTSNTESKERLDALDSSLDDKLGVMDQKLDQLLGRPRD